MKNLTAKLEKIIIAIAISAFVSGIFPQTFIQNANANEMFVSPSECKNVLVSGDPARKLKGFEPELKEFMEFLDTNFKNESSTSSLASLAIARYREYRESLRTQFKAVQKVGIQVATEEYEEGGLFAEENYEESFIEYSVCSEMVETYISLGRQEMLKHIKKSAAQKKTIMLLEKYKALNEKLKNLNMKIGEMAGLFATFRDKFPGYAINCMKM
ncbi:MAG: hypothetical protein PHP74_02260 [Candidatus Gracilibacteria bacterium]|nr:hypothetical protein [Candidatus Gracilibacteria bacterium]